MPRVDSDDHLRRPWRVHEVAGDFELLDVWDYPLTVPARYTLSDFADFTRKMESDIAAGSGPTAWLFKLRLAMGKVFGWDDNPEPLPIPGCTETTVRDRLETGEANRTPRDGLGFEHVYNKADERLLEISNSTVHALLHLSWIRGTDDKATPRIAVYVKPRGMFGRAYMALISPFRHLVVYPTLMRRTAAAWTAAHATA